MSTSIDIDELLESVVIKELRKQLCERGKVVPPSGGEGSGVPMGLCIVIADRGHVWVGTVERGPELTYLRKGATVRQWGTTKGLGEIADGGPTKSTVLDPVSTVVINNRSVIAFMPCDSSKWEGKIPTS